MKEETDFELWPSARMQDSHQQQLTRWTLGPPEARGASVARCQWKAARPKSQGASLTLFMSSCEGLAFCLGFGRRECRAYVRLEQVPEVVARQFQTQVLVRT